MFYVAGAGGIETLLRSNTRGTVNRKLRTQNKEHRTNN
jgi:hypothetical protein